MFTILWLSALLGQALVAPSQGTNLQLEVSATCGNAVLLVNRRVYSGRAVTLSVPLGEVVTLEIVRQQLNNCDLQQLLHYFDRWDLNGEAYSKAPQLRLRAGQPPFTANARLQAVYRAQAANLCEVAIDAQDTLGRFLHGTFIEVRPIDIVGEGDGVTPFVRDFDDLTEVLLRASTQVSLMSLSFRFVRWDVEGAQLLPTFSADPTLTRLRCSSARAHARAVYALTAAPTGCPDLTIRRLDVFLAPLTPSSWLLGPRAFVENRGTVATPMSSTTTFFLNGQPIGGVTTSPLAPGAGEQASASQLVSPGTYLVTVVADSKEQIAECNEENNVKELLVTVPGS